MQQPQDVFILVVTVDNFKKKSQRISEKHFVLVENLRLEAVDELANNATY